jgi:hypothetical protein
MLKFTRQRTGAHKTTHIINGNYYRSSTTAGVPSDFLYYLWRPYQVWVIIFEVFQLCFDLNTGRGAVRDGADAGWTILWGHNSSIPPRDPLQ